MLYCECKECFGTDDVMFCENKLVQARIAALKPETPLETSEPIKSKKGSVLGFFSIVSLFMILISAFIFFQ